jgi:NAD(P) transhydrogenase subunit alpha
MRIGVPKETRPDERRVAATPETVKKLKDKGHELVVEPGAGAGASIPDGDFAAAGATLGDAWTCELVLKVQPPRDTGAGHEAARLAEGAIVVSFMQPGTDKELSQILVAKKATVLAMEAVPRIARAQKMDALSSMANIAGYRAVLEACQVYGRYMPMLMTAAGSVPPAQVLVIGAGVAGLSAIATARRLGAVVKGYDTRPAALDQVKSVGGEPLLIDTGTTDTEDKGGYAKAASEETLAKQRAALALACKSSDIVITTALVGGKFAPRLIEAETVAGMKPGSVIVDLAAEGGGNCALTRKGERVEAHGVTILGYVDLPSRMATDASRLYARNVLNLVVHAMGKDGPGKEGLVLDMSEEVVAACAVAHRGELRHPGFAEN